MENGETITVRAKNCVLVLTEVFIFDVVVGDLVLFTISRSVLVGWPVYGSLVLFVSDPPVYIQECKNPQEEEEEEEEEVKEVE